MVDRHSVCPEPKIFSTESRRNAEGAIMPRDEAHICARSSADDFDCRNLSTPSCCEPEIQAAMAKPNIAPIVEIMTAFSSSKSASSSAVYVL